MPTDQEYEDFLASFDQPGAGAPPAAVAEGRDLTPGPGPSSGGGNPYWLGGGDQNGVPNYSPQNPPNLPPPIPTYNGPPMPPVSQFGQSRDFGPSYGSGMGPGNEATGQQVFGANLPQEQRFGDASNGYQVAGSRDLGPMLTDIAAGKSQIGAGLGRGMGDMMLGGVLDRMYGIGRNPGNNPENRSQPMIPKDTSNQQWRQDWIDNATNNNLRTVTPERQADGSINRVYGYENGRRQGEQYQAAPPPKPATPTYRGGSGEPATTTTTTTGGEGDGVLASFGLDRVRQVPGGTPILETFDHTTGTWAQAKDSAGKSRVITDPNAVVADMNKRASTLQASVSGQPMPELPQSTAMNATPNPSALAADLSNPKEGQTWTNARGEQFIYIGGQWVKSR